MNPIWRPAGLVLLDGFHNNETKDPEHYRWEGTHPGGFSELGKLVRSLGAELGTLKESATAQSLAKARVFIIVDPDTPEESNHPEYVRDSEISRQGPRLHHRRSRYARRE